MYDPSKIEPKWQQYWLENKTFKCEMEASKPKYYILDMFPYPSGAGLHVGHPEGYTGTDIMSRYKRMQGFNVLHPMGWDAFGLPAENYAIKTGRHPREVTDENVANFKRQIQSIGFSYDWDREIDTTDPDYYKWTQWIFLQLYKKGLAYQSELPINWCPSCKTGLANEEVVNGVCDRCGTPVTKKLLRQWSLKITEYAERLLEDLSEVDWPESIKLMQENWIGKSYGANIKFHSSTPLGMKDSTPLGMKDSTPLGMKDSTPLGMKNSNSKHQIEVFTTRPDTLFGATYLVLSPEHPLVYELVTQEYKDEVEKYKAAALMKSDLERSSLNKEKTGQFIGAYATNPVSGQEIPIWIADYVLMGYGMGAIMAVPAHDERDFEFAQRYELPIKQVVQPWSAEVKTKDAEASDEISCYTEDGTLINSGFLNGKKVEEAKFEMIRYLEEKGMGEAKVNYKLKDWVFSRQRYWGEPIPIVHCDACGPVPVPEDQLPVVLPEVENYQPSGTGESPLATIEEWVNTTCPKCNEPAKRETNTMPQWGGSCWYYLRYISPRSEDRFVNAAEEKYWMNVDLYVGGAEHAVLHLLYARFWHKVLFDLGFVSTKEPFQRLVNQGLILGEDGEKMSKSRGNVINPDDVIRQYGADTLRVYEMFMGPFEAVKPWSTQSIEGAFRFLQKVYRIVEEGKLVDEAPTDELNKLLHKTIKKVTEDTEQFGFNTAISAMMILANEVQKGKTVSKPLMKNLALMLSPYAPHLAEELWEMLGQKTTLAYDPWPRFDEKLTIDNTFELVFSVNGKVRGKKEVEKDISKEDAIALAKQDDGVQRNIEGKDIVKEIYVPGKLVNIVVK